MNALAFLQIDIAHSASSQQIDGMLVGRSLNVAMLGQPEVIGALPVIPVVSLTFLGLAAQGKSDPDSLGTTRFTSSRLVLPAL